MCPNVLRALLLSSLGGRSAELEFDPSLAEWPEESGMQVSLDCIRNLGLLRPGVALEAPGFRF